MYGEILRLAPSYKNSKGMKKKLNDFYEAMNIIKQPVKSEEQV